MRMCMHLQGEMELDEDDVLEAMTGIDALYASDTADEEGIPVGLPSKSKLRCDSPGQSLLSGRTSRWVLASLRGYVDRGTRCGQRRQGPTEPQMLNSSCQKSFQKCDSACFAVRAVTERHQDTAYRFSFQG